MHARDTPYRISNAPVHHIKTVYEITGLSQTHTNVIYLVGEHAPELYISPSNISSKHQGLYLVSNKYSRQYAITREESVMRIYSKLNIYYKNISQSISSS